MKRRAPRANGRGEFTWVSGKTTRAYSNIDSVVHWEEPQYLRRPYVNLTVMPSKKP